jgi:hypothetical protein
MAALHTAKPATAPHGEPASNIEQLGGQLDDHNNPTLIEIQARRLIRRFALTFPVACVVASLHYGEARR